MCSPWWRSFWSAAFAAAGVTLPTPFPRITYDEAMRQYGSDKPDLRLPGLTDVRPAFTDEALATLQIDPALPVVAFRIPNVGELSRKEREDNHPLFDKKKGAKFIDDFKRLAKSFPEAVDKIRELTGAQEGDFVIVVAGDPAHHIKASDTKFEGRLSEREINVYVAAGNFRTELAKKYADRHGAFRVTEEVVRTADPRGDEDRSTEQRLSTPSGLSISPCSSTSFHAASGCRRITRSPRPTKPTWPT